MYILVHTGMRISEFCGLTIKDIDFENHLINIDHQLQRSADMTRNCSKLFNPENQQGTLPQQSAVFL